MQGWSTGWIGPQTPGLGSVLFPHMPRLAKATWSPIPTHQGCVCDPDRGVAEPQVPGLGPALIPCIRSGSCVLELGSMLPCAPSIAYRARLSSPGAPYESRNLSVMGVVPLFPHCQIFGSVWSCAGWMLWCWGLDLAGGLRVEYPSTSIFVKATDLSNSALLSTILGGLCFLKLVLSFSCVSLWMGFSSEGAC